MFVPQPFQVTRADAIQIRGYKQDYHVNPAIMIWSNDEELVQQFKDTCYRVLAGKHHWFHQCNSREYQEFEFWTDDHDYVINVAIEVASSLNLEIF